MALPPGPQGRIRPLLAFERDPIGCLTRWHAEFGETIAVRAGRGAIVSLRGAKAVGEVLLDPKKQYVKDQGTREMIPLLGDGLLTRERDRWKGHRKLVAPTLRRNHIKHYGDIFVRHARSWAQGTSGEVDLHRQMKILTLGIVAESLFATTSVAEVDLIDQALEKAIAAHVTLDRGLQRILPLPAWLPGTPRWVFRQSAGTIDRLIRELIDARRTRPPGDDLLWRMIEARDEAGEGMDDDGLRAESATLYLAGHETTALSLTYAVYLLSRHPDALARLHAEVEAFGGRALGADDIEALPWTSAVIDEAMRLYPPTWMIAREPTQDVTLDGYDLPARTPIFVPIIAIHTDPARFPDPHVFRPERWLGAPRPSRWDYLPFGGGARICVGNHFALMEMVLVLATIAQSARFELLSQAEPTLLPSLSLRPIDGIPVRITH